MWSELAQPLHHLVGFRGGQVSCYDKRAASNRDPSSLAPQGNSFERDNPG